MDNIKNIFKLLICVLIAACFNKAAAQPVTDVYYCSGEFNRIRYVFSDSTHLSFQVAFYIQFSNGEKDTCYYNYKTCNNNAYLSIPDSMEIIQNEYYSLVLNHKRNKAELSKAMDVFNYIAHANILDNDFYPTLVNGMLVSDTGNLKKFSYSFKAASPYRQYDIVYDSVTHRINTIRYAFDAGAATASNSPFHVTMVFSNYQTGGFTDAVFSTDPYVLRRKGIFALVAPYNNYTLTNSLNQ